MCSFCDTHRETIHHLLVDCTKIRPLWTALQTWLNSILNLRTPIELSDAEIVLGSQLPNFVLINFISLITKQYIYRCKFFQNEVSVESVKAILKYRFNIEKQIGRKSGKMKQFLQKWAQLYEYCND
jgi:hypothetical protein